MAQPDPVTEPESPAATTAQVDMWQRTSMAAERTWLAWWRTALAATAGALGLLGCGYAAPALGLLVFGARRRRELNARSSTGYTRRFRSGMWRRSRSAVCCS